MYENSNNLIFQQINTISGIYAISTSSKTIFGYESFCKKHWLKIESFDAAYVCWCQNGEILNICQKFMQLTCTSSSELNLNDVWVR